LLRTRRSRNLKLGFYSVLRSPKGVGGPIVRLNVAGHYNTARPTVSRRGWPWIILHGKTHVAQPQEARQSRVSCHLTITSKNRYNNLVL